MKHPFSQQELANFVNEGRTILTKFRSAASIVWSHGVSKFIAMPMPHKATNLPFTVRGRIQAHTPDTFQKMLEY